MTTIEKMERDYKKCRLVVLSCTTPAQESVALKYQMLFDAKYAHMNSPYQSYLSGFTLGCLAGIEREKHYKMLKEN